MTTRTPSYDIGDAITPYWDFTDDDGVPTTPTAATLTITPPTGSAITKTITAGGLTSPSTGRLEYTHTFAVAGNHTFSIVATETIISAATRRYYVRQAGEQAS